MMMMMITIIINNNLNETDRILKDQISPPYNIHDKLRETLVPFPEIFETKICLRRRTNKNQYLMFAGAVSKPVEK